MHERATVRIGNEVIEAEAEVLHLALKVVDRLLALEVGARLSVASGQDVPMSHVESASASSVSLPPEVETALDRRANRAAVINVAIQVTDALRRQLNEQD